MSQDNNTFFEVAVGIPWIRETETGVARSICATLLRVARGRIRTVVRRAFMVTTLLGISGIVLMTGEAVVRARLLPAEATGPTRFFARPVMLKPGAELDLESIEETLQRLGYERTGNRRVALGQYRLEPRKLTIGRRAFRIFDRLDPGGVTTVRLAGGRITSLRDGRGGTLTSALLEPEVLSTRFGSEMRDLLPVPLSAVPGHVVNAILSVEDHRFFRHFGVDIRRVGGAAAANVRAGRIVQGASTITQQLARNLYLTSRRSWIRKLRELAMALVLEIRYDKERILEAYLNEVYLGQDGPVAIHGIGRAAQFYFGKDVSQLDGGDAALLAGIIRGPNAYAPFRVPDRALERRNVALGGMLEYGYISQAQYRLFSAEPLGLRTRVERNRTGRYFAAYSASRLGSRLDSAGLDEGLSVFTTLDLNLQRNAEDAVRDGLRWMESHSPALRAHEAPLQVALVALDPRTGEVLAMVGGRDFGESQFNRATSAHRQPGSVFKPIVALAALIDRVPGGRGQYTLASTLQDSPFTLALPAGDWQPNNYDGEYRGSITLREAMERSLNVPFARLGVDIGPEQIARTARDLGIESRLHLVPSLALGSSEVTLLEMTGAFGVLAAGGIRTSLRHSSGVLDRTGELIYQEAPVSTSVFDAAEVYLVTSALQSAVERGTGQALRTAGYYGPVAGKSGTTNDFRDAWFIGYTPSLVVGVWVGFDDGSNLGMPGSVAALPVVARFLTATLGPDGAEDFVMPPGIEVAAVSTDDGSGLRSLCLGETEIFLIGTAPKDGCSWRSRTRRARKTLPRSFRRVAYRGGRSSAQNSRSGI